MDEKLLRIAQVLESQIKLGLTQPKILNIYASKVPFDDIDLDDPQQNAGSASLALPIVEDFLAKNPKFNWTKRPTNRRVGDYGIKVAEISIKEVKELRAYLGKEVLPYLEKEVAEKGPHWQWYNVIQKRRAPMRLYLLNSARYAIRDLKKIEKMRPKSVYFAWQKSMRIG